MAVLLKNVYSKPFIENLAAAFKKTDKAFDTAQFSNLVFDRGWQQLELKARMRRISESLGVCLSGEYAKQLRTMVRVSQKLRLSSKPSFEYMFFPDFVEVFGMDDFEISISALETLTKLASSEFAVRPFILLYPNKMLKQLRIWSQSSDEDVRRLASEGCRPRLPWSIALPNYKRDPRPILKILNRLKNDQSLYVRRSVANNLNDISKDHPDLVIDLAKQWYGHDDNTDWLIRHACRGLLKKAHPDALTLFGFGDVKHLTLTNFQVPDSVYFEGYLPFSFKVNTTKAAIGKIRVEYGIDFMKANGQQARKIFKVAESDYVLSDKYFEKRHAFKTITTRKHYPGEHGIAILLNGVEFACRSFVLKK